MRKLEWSPDAFEDLDVIWSYIAEDNVERASSFVEELQAQARKKKFIRERLSITRKRYLVSHE